MNKITKGKSIGMILLAALMVCALLVSAGTALASTPASPTDPAADGRLDKPADDVEMRCPVTGLDVVEARCADTGHTVFEFGDGSRVRVIHNTPGSILLGYGGPIKCERIADVKMDIVLQLIRPLTVTTLNSDPELAAPEAGVGVQYYAPRHFDDLTNKPFGNSVVRTRHEGTADRSEHWTHTTDTVEGVTRTSWFGTVPQFNSDEIKLSESWTFHGVAVSVSFPPGLGFSGQGNTISWSAHDTSGQEWFTRHTYTGVAASTDFWFTGLTKDSTGSHRFVPHWISAMVHTPEI